MAIHVIIFLLYVPFSHRQDDPFSYCQNGVFFCFFVFNLFWLHLVFVAVRGAFSSFGERGLLFIVLRGLLIAVASLVACRAQAPGARASVVVACGLSSCGSRALERSLSSCGARA